MNKEENKTIIVNFGKKIKEGRKKRGWTQPDLAQILGYSSGLISQWENGLTAPSGAAVIKLIKKLNIKL